LVFAIAKIFPPAVGDEQFNTCSASPKQYGAAENDVSFE
jgi:hypothetical protein